MATASSKAKMKYDDKTYDRITFRVPKGKKAILNEHAEKQGESLNGFITRAVDNQIENDNKTAAD
ncbi:MAG: antitoxin [Oscillospiraceae bacterium]|nr:antitoxin [Oscillospiraceae bacterium]